jgi:hypothetical protein
MRRVLALAIAAWMVAACDVSGLFGPSGGVYPGACDPLGFGGQQCAAIVAKAAVDAALSAEAADSIDILPPTNDGRVRIGGYMIARVRFHHASEPDTTQEVWCTGVSDGGDRVCNPDPHIVMWAGVSHDLPCPGEPPDGCATPPATARPAIVAKATPLQTASLNVRIDHIGHYEIEVGAAGLPDGVLTESSATVADPRPTSFWIDNAISLVIRPLDPHRPPIGSVYREPFDGVEPVKVFLVFDVTDITPGGVLQVRDVVVR